MVGPPSVSVYDVFGLVRAGPIGTNRHGFVGSIGCASEDETVLNFIRARWMRTGLHTAPQLAAWAAQEGWLRVEPTEHDE